MKLGVSLQGVATLIIMTELLQFLRLHHGVSAVFEGMRRCLSTLLSFAGMYGTITLTFATGMYFVLRNSLGQCLRACGGNRPIVSNLSFANDSIDQPMTRKSSGKDCVVEFTEDVKIFSSFHNTVKYLFLDIFDPAYPDEIDKCTEGIAYYVGWVMWYLYFFIIAIVLLNLLIAMMNNRLSDIESVDTWKYYRTRLWMSFCHKVVVLPPPFNLIDYLLSLPLNFYRIVSSKCSNNEEGGAGQGREKQDRELMDKLVGKYERHLEENGISDFSEKCIEEHMKRMRQELNEVKENERDMNKKLDLILRQVKNTSDTNATKVA